MADKELIPIDVLRKLIRYEPDTGLLFWNERPAGMFTSSGKLSQEVVAKRWNSRCAGKPACNSVSDNGRKVGPVLGRMQKAHRVAYAIYHGRWPDGEVDHINGDPGDNRAVNLRDVSHGTNGRNQKTPRDNQSGRIGVSWYGPTKSWHARIVVGNRTKHLGYYASFEDACAARARAEAMYGYHPNHGR